MSDGFKSGFVALIGRTNVGKSTLMNRLIGQKVAITCNKPQTTRTCIRTILTEERGQIIFVDTPGIHRAQTKLGEYMVGVAERTLHEVDVILYMVEPCDHIGAGDRHILDLLGKAGDPDNGKTPKVLVINKIDTISREELAGLIAMFSAECDFDEVVPVSALKGDNEDVIKDIIYRLLPEGPMYYDEDELTDQPERQIVAELIRESALKALSDEVPHGIAVGIETMRERRKDGKGTGFFDIEATIVCERESHKGIIIGKKGSMLKKIGTNARLQIEALLGYRINLQLFVKVKKDWRDSDFLLKNYGFADEDEA
ncbi:MAG: GTPase Era [Lachnospiraceae bacterium]|nr:GTPase Era [Lachnospiraceae bacterium]